jgi:tetratricopeptide (TPR) repeat protein
MNALLATLVPLLAGAAAPAQDPLAEATQAANQRQYVQAITKAMSVAGSAQETAQRRGKAFELAAQAYLDIGCPRLAIATYHQALVALGRDNPSSIASWWRIAQIHVARLEYHEVISLLERATTELDMAKVPPEHRAKILGLLATCREQVGQVQAALAAYESLLSVAKPSDDVGSFLARAARLYAELQRFDKAQGCLDRLYGKLDTDTVVAEATKAYQEFALKLAAVGRNEEADAFDRKLLSLFARREPSISRAALLRLFEGDDDAAILKLVATLKDTELRILASDEITAVLIPAAIRLGRTDELARVFFRAILAEPLDENTALLCLKAIMELRVREGRLDDGLAAAYAAYSTCGFGTYASPAVFGKAVDLVAEALRARDGHLVSGNLFRQYQLTGPAGPDRKPGTPDDLPSPVANVAFKPDPELDKLFEAAIAAQPLSVAGHRARGWLCLAWCKPRKALGEFKRAFAICSLETAEINRVAQDVALGLKALHGTPVGMEAFADFQRHGPNGPDGRKGTPDDLKDPLEGI